MNIKEINPEEAAPGMALPRYFAVAVPLTALTVWIVIAAQFQIEDPRVELRQAASAQAMGAIGFGLRAKHDQERKMSMGKRLLWPVWLCMSIFMRWRMLNQTGSKRVTMVALKDKSS
jgi:hypothetical protein